MFIVIGILFLSFFFWLRSTGRKKSQDIQTLREDFWEKESQANATRKADISGLDYIKIPFEKLPFLDTQDTELLVLQNNIKSLADNPILNLTGLTNTDLKLTYGTANITFLSDCDSNFTTLVNHLYKWGQYLYDNGKIPEALQVLEFGISCRTDVSKNYILLANIYKEINVPEKIDNLIGTAGSLKTLKQDSILSVLKEIKLSTYLV